MCLLGSADDESVEARRPQVIRLCLTPHSTGLTLHVRAVRTHPGFTSGSRAAERPSVKTLKWCHSYCSAPLRSHRIATECEAWKTHFLKTVLEICVHIQEVLPSSPQPSGRWSQLPKFRLYWEDYFAITNYPLGYVIQVSQFLLFYQSNVNNYIWLYFNYLPKL